MPWGIGLDDLPGAAGRFFDDDEDKPKRPKPPKKKPPKKKPEAKKPPTPSRAYYVPVPKALRPQVRKATEENLRRLAKEPPPRPSGLGGFLDDITEGRGILGLATTGPIGLFARDDARRALFSGKPGKAIEEAIKLGRYRPPPPGKTLGKRTQQAGPGAFMDWLGNVNRGVNVLPSMFADVGEVAGRAVASDVAKRRGIVGLATTGPIGLLANKQAREALFSGDIEKAISETVPNWNQPRSELDKLSEQIIKGSISDTKRAFSDPDYWYEDPVNAAFAAAIVLGPASRAAGIAKTASKLKAVEGAKALDRYKVAVAENFVPGISGLKQGVRREIPTGRGDETLGITASRHPFGRALQRQFDLTTRRIDPEARLIGGLAAPRRARRLEARRRELGQRRLQRDVNYANRKAALYINEGLITKGRGLVGDSLRRGRDSAIVMALQAPADLEPLEGVKYAINDTDDILARGTAYAPDGDLADLTVVPAGQEAYFDGELVNVTNTAMVDGKLRVTAQTAGGETVEGSAARFQLSNGDERVRINLTDDQRARLEQRRNDLSEALHELEQNPKQAQKFSDSVKEYEQLGALNEDLGHVIAKSTVGSDEWQNFLEGGRVRRNLMARRWRKQGLRAGEEELDIPVTDHPHRQQFHREITGRLGEQQAAPIMYLADRMARTAAERAAQVGREFSAADWWNRIRRTSSGTYRASDQTGDFLYHEAGPRTGLVRTSASAPEELGLPLHGTVIKRGSDVHAWSGITDNGDGTVRAWNQQEGWVDNLDKSVIEGGQPFPGFDAPLRVGERVDVTEPVGSYGTGVQSGKVSGYHEHPERGPEISVLMDSGETMVRPRSQIQRQAGQGQGPIFYSKAQETIAADSFPPKATAQQVTKALEKAGVKKEEIFWTGIEEFAELYDGKSIPKEDLLNHLENSLNGLNIDEIVYSSLSSSHPTKWDGYNGEGGLVIREPTSEHPYYELVMAMPDRPGQAYTGGHFSVPNQLFHIRFHEIEDLDGVPALLIDELQSDPHAAARRDIQRGGRGYSEVIPKEVRDRIGELEDRRRAVAAAQAEIPDGYNVRYDVEENRKKWAYERIDQMKEEGMEGFDSTAYMWADIMRDTNWRDPEIMAQLERAYPGHAEKVKAMDRYMRLEDIRTRLNARVNDLETPYSGAVPNMPFKGDAWMALALKRLVAWGVDNGQQRVYWTRGHEHMVRYDKIDDLPTERRRDMEPDDYFYNSYASVEEEFGDHLMGQWGPMQEPLEGMNLALLEKGEAPSQPQRMADIPPERGFADPDHIDPDLQGDKYVVHNGRFARILDWDEEREGWDIEYVPATLDPWNVEVNYRGYGGDSNNYDVKVTNRLGEEVFRVDMEDAAGPYGYSNFWEEVGEKVDREMGERGLREAQEQYAIRKKELDDKLASGEEPEAWRVSAVTYAEQRLANVKANYNPKAVEMTEMLGDIERGSEIPSSIDRNMENELDEERWNEYLDEQGGGSGNFEDIRDWDSGLEGSHVYFYDKMLPKAAKDKVLKPWKGEPFYKERAYIGRYSTEGSGVISAEGELPAFGFDITDDMAQSVRDSRQSLFQQPVDGSAVPKGSLEFLQGTMQNPEAVAIRLFDDADASTVIHELGHIGLYDLHPRDLKIIEDELQGGKMMADWERTDYERFARAFERHIMGEPSMNPKLAGPFQALAEIMQNIYRTITGYFDDVPVSEAVSDVFDRLINPRSVDEARAYFPHRSAFDFQQTDVLGGVRLPAAGSTLGIPKQDRRAFPNKANAEVLWETGELNPSTGALTTQVVRRGRYKETLDIRTRLFNEANPIKADQGIPPGSYLIRDPEAPLEKIPQRVTAAQRLDEQSFRELTGDKDIEDWREALKNIVMTPDEMADAGVSMKNVRWIEPWKVESLVRSVFPSAPQGKGAAALGMANTVSRMSQIYLRPIRYLTGNIPANIVLMALTNPTAMPRASRYLASAIRNSATEFGRGPADLAKQRPELFNAIRSESGDIMAGAGLPEFYTRANNTFQKAERKLNRWSAEASDRLGEIADQPFRVAVWITHAKRYGYDTPEEWEHLLATRMQHDPSGRPIEQLSPEEQRIRDEIAQKTREDMIDFNAMTPWERQHISRFFYLWAFTRGFVKWPLTFARDYPERLAGVGLAAEATEGEESERPFSAEWLDARGQSMIHRPDGSRLDFSSWNPVSGGVEAWNTAAGLGRGSVRGVTDYLSPTLSALGEAAFNPTREEGWSALKDEALGAYVPAPVQSAITDITGMETPASRRAEARGKKGIWAKVDNYLEAASRFQQGKYSPSITKKRVADWKDLTADYTVTTANYDPEEVTKSYQAYWLYKEYEQRVKYGIGQREGRQGLTDKEKAILLRRVAAETYGDANIASVEEIDKASADDLAEFVDAMDWMFKARTGVMSGATRRRNEAEDARKQAAGVSR